MYANTSLNLVRASSKTKAGPIWTIGQRGCALTIRKRGGCLGQRRINSKALVTVHSNRSPMRWDLATPIGPMWPCTLVNPERRWLTPFLTETVPREQAARFVGCMVGCRYGAKNTLDKNYLYLAERLGVRIVPEVKVDDIRPITTPGGPGYEITAYRSGAWLAGVVPGLSRRRFRAKNVVVAAGVLGTVSLLMKCRDRGSLKKLSAQLGNFVRTNPSQLSGPWDGMGKKTEAAGSRSHLDSIRLKTHTSKLCGMRRVRTPWGALGRYWWTEVVLSGRGCGGL